MRARLASASSARAGRSASGPSASPWTAACLGWVGQHRQRGRRDGPRGAHGLAARPECTALLGYTESLPTVGAARAGRAPASRWRCSRPARSRRVRRAAALAHRRAGDRRPGGGRRAAPARHRPGRTTSTNCSTSATPSSSRAGRPAHRVAVVTTSGGSGILAADAIAAARPELASLAPATARRAGRDRARLRVHGEPGGRDRHRDERPHAVRPAPRRRRRRRRVDASSPASACSPATTWRHCRPAAPRSRSAPASRSWWLAPAPTSSRPQASAALRAAGIPAYPTPARAVRAPRRCWDDAARRGRCPRPRRGSRVRRAGATRPSSSGCWPGAGHAGPARPVVTGAEDAAAPWRRSADRRSSRRSSRGCCTRPRPAAWSSASPRRGRRRRTQRHGRARRRRPGRGGRRGGREMLVGVAATPLGPVLTLGARAVCSPRSSTTSVFRLLPVSAGGRARHDRRAARRRACTVFAAARRRRRALVRLIVDVSSLVGAWQPGYELDLNPVAVPPDGVRILDAASSHPDGELA